MEVIRDCVKQEVGKIKSAKSKGTKTKQHFSMKVTTESGTSTIDVMSHQMIQQLSAGLRGLELKDKRIKQVTFSDSKPRPDGTYDGVTSWTVAPEGKGSIAEFSPRLTQEDLEDEELEIGTDTAIYKVLSKVETSGYVKTTKSVFFKTQWERKLTLSDLVANNVIGYVDRDMFKTVYKKRAQGEFIEGMAAATILDGHTFLVIDPFSHLILSIPTKFFREDSSFLTENPEWGVAVTPGLLDMITAYGSVMMMGLCYSEDWDDLNVEDMIRPLEDLPKIKEFLDEAVYKRYAQQMVFTLNSLSSRLYVVPGSKKSPDKYVSSYFADKKWRMDEKIVLEVSEGFDDVMDVDI